MKKLCLVFTALLCMSLHVLAGNYQNFKVSVYVWARDVVKMDDSHWLDSTWTAITQQVKIDKVYLETHRDMVMVPASTIEKAKKFFLKKGVEVAGGITFTVNESNNFETFSYANPEHRKKVQEIAEFTAKHFDEFILDDFFFTDTKSDFDIKAKGNKSWANYRLELMTEAGKNLVIAPAKKVNPKVKVIIKYPNWYDHFQGLGFDLEHGPQIFDGIWTGTETRNPASNQHLQNYLSYNIIRYFNNLRPGYNGGGWVDSGGIDMGMDRYAEQLWLTMFAKAPEMILFNYSQLLNIKLLPLFRTPWQGQGTSFDYDAMMEPISVKGKSVQPTTIARAAGLTFETIDRFVGKLGKPIGIKSYKPFHSLGDDFLQNYLGMIGLPMDMYPAFPEGCRTVLLTEQAKADAAIVDKMKAQLEKGGDVVITSSLLKAIPEKIAEIAELRCTDLKAIVNDFGMFGTSKKDILIPQIRYQTNDTWETVSAGRPLKGGVSGFPVMLRSPYSKGNLYVLTIPDDMGNLYDFPDAALNSIRKTMSHDLDIYIKGPSKVSLFLYDNRTFIIESFNDNPVEVQVMTKKSVLTLKNLLNNESLSPEKVESSTYMSDWRRVKDDENGFKVTLKPHSYQVFSY